MSKKHIVLFVLLLICPLLVSNYFKLLINTCDSLPYKVFLLRKDELPTSKGQLIVFNAKDNKKYKSAFIKIIGGTPGDIVSRKDRSYFINGKFIGVAKETSKEGEVATLGPTGEIPHGQYFVYTTHPDSYDSKYEDIGWIKDTDILGIAYPIF